MNWNPITEKFEEKDILYTEEEINNIIDLKDTMGNQLDIFHLGGILYLDDGDMSKTNNKFSAHSLHIDFEAFRIFCSNEDQVLDTFHEELKKAVVDQLL